MPGPILLLATDRACPAAHLRDFLARAGLTTIAIMVRDQAELPDLALLTAACAVVVLDTTTPSPAEPALLNWLGEQVYPRQRPVLALGAGARLAAQAAGARVAPCPATRGWLPLRAAEDAPAGLDEVNTARALICRSWHSVPPANAQLWLETRPTLNAASEPVAYATNDYVALEFVPAPAPHEYAARLQEWTAAGEPASSRVQTIAELEHSEHRHHGGARQLAETLYRHWLARLPA